LWNAALAYEALGERGEAILHAEQALAVFSRSHALRGNADLARRA